jgi:hypothetical protein
MRLVGRPLFKWAVVVLAAAFGLWGLAGLVGPSNQQEPESLNPQSQGIDSPEPLPPPPTTPEVQPEVTTPPPPPAELAAGTPTGTNPKPAVRQPRGRSRRPLSISGTRTARRPARVTEETILVIEEEDENLGSQAGLDASEDESFVDEDGDEEDGGTSDFQSNDFFAGGDDESGDSQTSDDDDDDDDESNDEAEQGVDGQDNSDLDLDEDF